MKEIDTSSKEATKISLKSQGASQFLPLITRLIDSQCHQLQLSIKTVLKGYINLNIGLLVYLSLMIAQSNECYAHALSIVQASNRYLFTLSIAQLKETTDVIIQLPFD